MMNSNRTRTSPSLGETITFSLRVNNLSNFGGYINIVMAGKINDPSKKNARCLLNVEKDKFDTIRRNPYSM